MVAGPASTAKAEVSHFDGQGLFASVARSTLTGEHLAAYVGG